MALLLIAFAVLLAARGLVRAIKRDRLADAAPQMLAALLDLRENVHMVNRQSGQHLRDAADAAIYAALGLKV